MSSNKLKKTYKLDLSNSLKLSNPSERLLHSNGTKKNQSDIYLMQICGNLKRSSKVDKNDFKFACLNSEQIITIYDENLFEKAKIYEAHADTIINEIEFFKQNKNLLLTCGDDGLLKCWDLRATRKEVLIYDITSSEESNAMASSDESSSNLKLLSCDINLDDSIIASSTNNNDNNDSFIYLFDVKMSNKVLKKYSDAHSNDITQVKFDPYVQTRLVSASIDGLACVFDLTNLDKTLEPRVALNDEENDIDDDLIDHVYNTTSSIQKIGYLNRHYLFAITFTNDLFIWDLDTQDELFKINYLNDSCKYKYSLHSDYIVDCINVNMADNDDDIVICLGDKLGNLQLYDLHENLLFNTENSKSNAPSLLKHNDIVRGVYWNYYTNDLYSIGEDSILNKWRLSVAYEAHAREEEKESVDNTSKKRVIHDEDDKSSENDSDNDDNDDDGGEERARRFKRTKKTAQDFDKKNKKKKKFKKRKQLANSNKNFA